MIPICLVCGTSGSGKTTLVTRLVELFSGTGKSVATVKHHRGSIETDREGKDSWLHRRAGSIATFLVTEKEITGFIDRGDDFSLETLANMVPKSTDLLLVEGFKGLTGYPRVEIVRNREQGILGACEEVLCVVTDLNDLDFDGQVFGMDDVEQVARMIKEELL